MGINHRSDQLDGANGTIPFLKSEDWDSPKCMVPFLSTTIVVWAILSFQLSSFPDSCKTLALPMCLQRRWNRTFTHANRFLKPWSRIPATPDLAIHLVNEMRWRLGVKKLIKLAWNTAFSHIIHGYWLRNNGDFFPMRCLRMNYIISLLRRTYRSSWYWLEELVNQTPTVFVI